MNQQQELIVSKADQIRRAIFSARERGLSEAQILIVLVDSEQERDTWPAPPPSGSISPRELAQIACAAMDVSAAKTLIQSLCRCLEVPPLPGYVRVLAIAAGAGFFTHVFVEASC